MKRLLIGVWVVLFTVCSLNAEVVNFFTPVMPEISIKQNIQFNLLPDSKEKGIGFSTIADCDFNELYINTGLNYTNNQFDFTLQSVYWPTFFDIVNFGLGFTYHLYDYPHTFIEQDFLSDIYLKVKFCQYFMVWTRWGYLYKKTKVQNINTDFKNQIKTMNFNLSFNVYPHPDWTCYLTFDSNSFFNYPNFITIFLTTGVEFEAIKEKFSTGLEISTKWYDAVVVPQNISQMNLKVFGRYKI